MSCDKCLWDWTGDWNVESPTQRDSVMYWKGMQRTIQSYVKSCRSFQINKRHSQKYRHVPPKLVITTPWNVLCVDLIGPYTLNGKDGSSIDFMCLTMIDPATSWFEIVELPKLQRETSGSKVTTKNTKEADTHFGQNLCTDQYPSV